MSLHQAALATLTVAALIAPSQAFAQQNLPPLYWEVNYGQLQTKSPDLNLDIVTATFGAQVSPFMAFEGYAGTSISDEQYAVGGSQVAVKVKQIYGINLKPSFALSKNARIFAKFGYRWAEDETKLVGGTGKVSNDSDGVVFAVGGEYQVFNNFYINTSYNYLETDDSDDAALINLGIGHKF